MYVQSFVVCIVGKMAYDLGGVGAGCEIIAVSSPWLIFGSSFLRAVVFILNPFCNLFLHAYCFVFSVCFC